jgi:hypothetical protein
MAAAAPKLAIKPIIMKAAADTLHIIVVYPCNDLLLYIMRTRLHIGVSIQHSAFIFIKLRNQTDTSMCDMQFYFPRNV